jgi:N-acetylglutamate synthase-like GNAT family acetyltransferase
MKNRKGWLMELRPPRPEDWEALLDLANQAVPFAPRENAEWLEYRKAFDESKRMRRHYIAAEGETPVGYGCLEQQGDDPQKLRIFVVANPVNLDVVGQALYAHLLKDAKELGAMHLWAREFLKDEPIREFFLSHGFKEDQRFRLPGMLPMVVFKLHLDL